VGRMIADPKDPPDDLRHAFGRPDLAAIAIRFSPWCYQARQLLHLLARQLRRRPFGWMASERLDATFTSAPEPLTDGPWRHAECRGDVLLFPARLFEFPGPPSAAFEPIRVCFLCLHIFWFCRFRASRRGQ
jgi:hypothetical protein